MKIAIMQPYFCPHIGYFQLVNAVDLFVFYDDVQYIKRGYINRNTLKNDLKFTVPVSNASTKKRIHEVEINWDNEFFNKFPKTVRNLYAKCPNYEEVSSILNSLFSERPKRISDLAINSIISFSEYMGIKTKFLKSSSITYNKTKDKALNLINICKTLNFSKYVNSIGGLELYDQNFFKKHGVELQFLKGSRTNSIIDVCISNSTTDINDTLNNIELI
jgi:hypothetical protein